MNSKHCPYCHCSRVIKYGRVSGRQRYRCKNCHKVWASISRKGRRRQQIWHDYVDGMTAGRVAEKYSISARSVRRILAAHNLPALSQKPRCLVIVADATYFSRTHGELVVVDPNAQVPANENFLIYHHRLSGSERIIDYQIALDSIQAMGYHIQAVTIDGRRGVKELCVNRGLPVQYCHFHQLLTITQCLTRHPKLPANAELRQIAMTLTHTSRNELADKLDNWYQQYGSWLKERYLEPGTGRKRYVHDRTRRAYYSLMRNLPYLFTYQDFPSLNIPNTTNKLDGAFGVAKRKLKAHPGITDELKTKMLYSFLSGATERGNN